MVTKGNVILFCVLLLFFSCKSEVKVDIDQVFRDSEQPELDMIFYELTKSIKERNGVDFAIVDRTINDNHSDSTAITPMYWNKAIFPNAIFIDADSLFLNNQADKMHLNYTEKYANGYIEITPPYFVNPDKGIAYIRVKFYQFDRIKVYSLVLEKKGYRYVRTKDELVAQFNENVLELADPYYKDYVPYAGFVTKEIVE